MKKIKRTREQLLNDLNFTTAELPSVEEIKKRWKELCRKHHPDLGGREEDFLRVTHAYKMLTDPSYEASQDNNLNTIDLTIHIQYVISFEDAFRGKKCNISFTPIEFGTDGEPVPSKDGDAYVISQSFTLEEGCFFQKDLTFPGKGNSCDGQLGDLVVHVLVQKHQKFVPQEGVFGTCNILTKETIPLHLMLKGGKLRVQTLRGPRMLKIPPGTSPGEQISIRGCGARGGKHICEIHPAFPDKATLKSKTYEGLGINWDSEVDNEEEELGFEQIFDKILKDSVDKQVKDIRENVEERRERQSGERGRR